MENCDKAPLSIILQKLEKIERDVSELKILCLENKKNCEKMSEHIDFVDETYEKFKHPLNVVKNMVSWRVSKQIEN